MENARLYARRLLYTTEYFTLYKWRAIFIIVMAVILSLTAFKMYRMDTLARKDLYRMATGLFVSDESLLQVGEFSLEEMDIEELKFMLHGLLSRNFEICSNTTIFGRTNLDGGYSVCTTGKLAPDRKSCKVLSFGINNEWSFDEGIAGYGCYVHSFDPSMGKEDHMHKPNIAFHNLGLAKENGVNSKGWKMKNIMTIMKELKLENEVIDVIKCDAEGAEWPFLEDIFLKGIKVKQIILEIHSFRPKPQTNSKEDYAYMIRIFLLLKRHGYVVWKNHQVYSCCAAYSGMMPRGIQERCCHEVYLYNKRFVG